MKDDDPLQRAHLAALRFLSYRPRTESEVRSRLRRRFPAPVVEQVLELLTDEALVDDARFASQWRASRESHHPRSGWAIKRELLAKGVDGLVAEEAVQDIDDEDNAYRAGLKAAGRLAGSDISTFNRRLWSYLKRRGFSDSLSRRTITRLWEEMDGQNESKTLEER